MNGKCVHSRLFNVMIQQNNGSLTLILCEPSIIHFIIDLSTWKGAEIRRHCRLPCLHYLSVGVEAINDRWSARNKAEWTKAPGNRAEEWNNDLYWFSPSCHTDRRCTITISTLTNLPVRKLFFYSSWKLSGSNFVRPLNLTLVDLCSPPGLFVGRKNESKSGRKKRDKPNGAALVPSTLTPIDVDDGWRKKSTSISEKVGLGLLFHWETFFRSPGI